MVLVCSWVLYHVPKHDMLLWRSKSLKKNHVFSPRSLQTPMALQVWITVHDPSFIHAEILGIFLLFWSCLCNQSQLLWTPVCNSPVKSRICFFFALVLQDLSLIIFWDIFHKHPLTLQGGYYRDVPFMADNSMSLIPYTLAISETLLIVKEAFMIWVERCTNLWI